jgi:homogentisate 1,2-dioxygenase
MPIYRSHGLIPKKHFTLIKGPHDEWCHEELITNEGFNGESSLIYHLRPPTSMLRIEELPPIERKIADTPLGNYLFSPGRLQQQGDMLTARRTLFQGAHVSFAVATPSHGTEGFYRNAWSDELVLITSGSGVLRSAFGELHYRELDLVHVPRSITVQWIPDPVPHRAAIVESTSPITIPPHFRDTRTGQFHSWAPYRERDLRTPEPIDPVDELGEFPILVKYGDRLSRVWLDHHPFDVVGWDGYLYPFALNLQDYEPVVGQTDLLPDQYQVFVTEGTLMMLIVPRRKADHPDSSPAQAHHMNADIDEVLYRIGGSNRATDPGGGTITLHPRGLSHGPRVGFLDQPKTDRLPLYAFMLDTRDHLELTSSALDAMEENDLSAWRASP